MTKYNTSGLFVVNQATGVAGGPMTRTNKRATARKRKATASTSARRLEEAQRRAERLEQRTRALERRFAELGIPTVEASKARAAEPPLRPVGVSLGGLYSGDVRANVQAEQTPNVTGYYRGRPIGPAL